MNGIVPGSSMRSLTLGLTTSMCSQEGSISAIYDNIPELKRHVTILLCSIGEISVIILYGRHGCWGCYPLFLSGYICWTHCCNFDNIHYSDYVLLVSATLSLKQVIHDTHTKNLVWTWWMVFARNMRFNCFSVAYFSSNYVTDKCGVYIDLKIDSIAPCQNNIIQ